ncbi:MAG: cellulase family glycosylhydrolase [Acidimicrobiales bacterium]
MPPNVGVQFHAMWEDYDVATRTAVFDKLAAAKVGWVRVDLGWSSFEERGRGVLSQWYVDRADAVVDQAAARGIKVLGMLWATPGWANGGGGSAVPPSDPGDYARFARWAAEHFRGRVSAWEVWNEPNDRYFWAADAARYAALVRAAYPSFKAGDPAALVVAGSTVHNDDGWLAAAYDAGMGGFFDVLSTHPYMAPTNAPPDLADDGTIWRMDHVRAVRALMVARGDGAKPIWFTEFGWSSHANLPGMPNWKLGVTESEQADYLVKALAQMAGQYPYVTNAFWYNERSKATGDPQEDNLGLLRRDLTEKPAYQALRSALSAARPPTSTTTTAVTASTTTSTTTTAVAASTTTSTPRKQPRAAKWSWLRLFGW